MTTLLMFRLAVVHSLPSAIRLEEAIVPDRFWSFAEPCVEPAPPTNPNAILSAIAAALIRLVAHRTIYGSNSLQAVRTASIMQPNRGSLRRLPRNGSYFDSHGALMNPN